MKLAKKQYRESNPHTYINTKDIVNYTTVSNNRSAAAIEAFRILVAKKGYGIDVSKFDQDLCIRLVKAYDLSCSDCKLECPQHGIEEMK